MTAAYDKYGKGVIGVKPVSMSDIGRYGSVSVSPLEERIFRCGRYGGKTTADAVLSEYAVAGPLRAATLHIDILEETATGVGGEIQTHRRHEAPCQHEGMVAVHFHGGATTWATNSTCSEPPIEVDWSTPEVGEGLRAYLKEISGIPVLG